MADRPSAAARASAAPIAELVLVCCTVRDGALSVLVRGGASVELPRADVAARQNLDAGARALAASLVGRAASWVAQARADSRVDARRGAPILVSYAAIAPAGTDAPEGWQWIPATRVKALNGTDTAAVASAVAVLRDRMDLEPIAFRLLPSTFTLSELQALYEHLLGRRLHKASFRRALAGAFLVLPTDNWRSEGRGRPAQLFRYAPRRGGRGRRSVRLELLR